MKRKIYIPGGIILFIIIIGFILYGQGYRLGGSYFGKVGGVYMNIPYKDTSIYIDEGRRILTTKDNEDVNITLTPTVHSIIVSHAGYLPWTKNVKVISSGKVSLFPIFAAQNSAGYIVGPKDPEYLKIKNSITKDILPTKEKPLLSKDQAVSIWIEGNSIMAKVKDEISIVIQPETAIRNLDFYKNRSDVIIYSSGNSIYVVEIDKEDIQNFLPIFIGKSPSFVKADENFIYVLDGNELLQVAA